MRLVWLLRIKPMGFILTAVPGLLRVLLRQLPLQAAVPLCSITQRIIPREGRLPKMIRACPLLRFLRTSKWTSIMGFGPVVQMGNPSWKPFVTTNVPAPGLRVKTNRK